MKKLLFSVITIILTLSAIAGEPKTCADIHTGVFKIVGNNSDITIIKRTKRHQFEIKKSMKYKAKFDVVWTDECTYKLRNKKLIRGPKEYKGVKGSVLIVHIDRIEGDTVYVSATATNIGLVVEIEMIIIE